MISYSPQSEPMLNPSLITFLGISISILVIFIVLDGKKNIYSMILKEIQDKIVVAINWVSNRKKVQIETAQKATEKYSAHINDLLQNDEEQMEKQAEKAAFVEGLKKKVDERTNKLDYLVSQLEAARDNISTTPPSIMLHAPYYTILFCLLLIGMNTYLDIRFHNWVPNIDMSVFLFTIFSILCWFIIWFTRIFIVGFPFMPKVSKSRKSAVGGKVSAAVNRYRGFIQRHTTFVTVGLLAIMGLVWWLTMFLLDGLDLNRNRELNGFIVITGFLFWGLLGYLAKKDVSEVPILNFYGQVIVILLVSILIKGLASEHHILLFSSTFMNRMVLNKAIFYFVFLNGFTLPILVPLVYYHCKILLAYFRCYGVIRALQESVDNLKRALLKEVLN